MTGPPRKPIEFRRREGNPAGRKLPVEPETPRGMPEAPSDLDAVARECWDELVPMLYAMRVLSLVDRKMLEAGCIAYSEMKSARKTVLSLGATYEAETATGTIVRARPEVAQGADAWRRFKHFLCEYGLTAASRSRVVAAPVSDNETKADFA